MSNDDHRSHDHTIKAIETKYAGCRFRSRLEARWAVFFNTLGVPWEYEPQGFILSNGTYYLPDFLLTDCGTWVEVKGAESALDKNLMRLAARDLPFMNGRGERGPRMLVLGPIPDVTQQQPDRFGEIRDLTWVGLDSEDPELRVGFGHYYKNHRPWWDDLESPLPWLTPVLSESESMYDARDAYVAARSARFEHGECG